jgi:hypothetical protein
MTAAEQLATLSDTEVAELLALVRARRAASGEGRAEADAAAYAATIAEREAREAADPELQRSRREAALEAQRRAEQERATELAELEALAKRDPRVLAQPRLDNGETATYRCSECHVPIFEGRLTGLAVLCGPHYAKHRLKCDVCGAGEGVLTTRFRDRKWRCDTCAAAHVAQVTE